MNWVRVRESFGIEVKASRRWDPPPSRPPLLGPDGSSWQLTKSVFDFPNGLLVGPNLDAVIVEGVNALSLSVYGNATIEKSINGSIVFGNGYVSGGTESDGHDAYYTEDPSKGFRVGRGNLGGFGGGQGPGKGFSLGSSGAGGLSGGGGSFAGEGGAGASGPSGITYGTGGMEVLVGGSGGGFGSFGDAAAGGGALEILSSGKILIGSGVKISMNGGAVLVNPSVGANFSGGAGSGGAIRMVAGSIENKGFSKRREGMPRVWTHERSGAKFLSNSGGAGGGGRVALISDLLIDQGKIFLDGGLSNGDGSGGNPGTLFVGPRTVGSPSSLSLSDGNLIFDTGGSWSHSSGLSGKGSITTHDFLANGRRWGYSVCTFSFTDLTLGSGVNVTVRGENSLRLQVDGNVGLSNFISIWMGNPGSRGFIQEGVARADGLPVVVCAIPIFFPICIRLLTDKVPEEDEVTKSENQPEAEVMEPLDRVD